MIKLHIKDFENKLKNANRNLKTIFADTLTQLAKAAKDNVKTNIPKIFKRPVAYTKNSPRYFKAKANKTPINSRVLILDKNSGRGTPPATYLQQVAGLKNKSNRPSELKLIRKGKLKPRDHLFSPRLQKYSKRKWEKILTGVEHYEKTGKEAYFVKSTPKLRTIFKIKRLKKRNKLEPMFFAKEPKPTPHIFKFEQVVSRYVHRHYNDVFVDKFNGKTKVKLT